MDDLKNEQAPSDSQLVVLIHGLGASRLDMLRLALNFRKFGYSTLNYGYGSLRRSIACHAQQFREVLRDHGNKKKHESIHVVSHSMGCIVTRAALLGAPLERVSRIVMLAPPNQGSHVARLLTPTLGRFVRTLRELSDAEDSYVRQLAEPTEYEIGIVAAARDRVIEEPATHLSSESDHIVLPGHHAMLSWRKFAAHQAMAFMQSGRFCREESGYSLGQVP